MALIINTNIPSIGAYNILKANDTALAKTIQQLSTGLRINTAADDAAGLAISEHRRSQLSGMTKAMNNMQDAISLIQTAEGGLSQIHSTLQRMRELSVQAASEHLTANDRAYIQEEFGELRTQIDRIGTETQFNTKSLLDGSAAAMWSSDKLSTKAVIRTGLTSIDQFGQKVSVAGNYKITINAAPGTGEVQKTNIFRIRHDVGQGLTGTGTFAGAALEDGADLEGVGARELRIQVGDDAENVTYTLILRHDLTDAEGLAEAVNAAMTQIGSSDETNKRTGEGDLVSAALTGVSSAGDYKVSASVDGNGNLTLTNDSGKAIKLMTGANTDDLQRILGATNETALLAQEYEQTLKFGTISPADWDTALTDGTDYGFSVTLNGVNSVDVSLSGAEIKALYDEDETGAVAAARAALKDVIVSQLNENAVGLTASLDDLGNLLLKSEGGDIAIQAGTDDLLADVLGVSDIAANTLQGPTVYTNKSDTLVNAANLTDTDKAATDFSANFNDAANPLSFTVTAGGTTATVTVGAGDTLSRKLAGDPDHAVTLEDLETDIREQLAEQDLADRVSVTAEDGKLRLFAPGRDLTIQAAGGGDGVLSALFGNIQTDGGAGVTVEAVDDATANNGYISKIVVKSASDGGVLADVLSLERDYSFSVNGADGEELASVSLSGPFDSAEDAAARINAQLAGAVPDLSAVVVTEEGTRRLAIRSAGREFTLSGGYEALFGAGSGAESSREASVSTIGSAANASTRLRDIEQFWDAEGNFLLEEPQKLTLTQTDGTRAAITLYGEDTLGDLAAKLNDAIGMGLGQAQYVLEKDKFATFVPSPGEGMEAVEGTIVVRSVAPGVRVSFAGQEALLKALSLNTLQEGTPSTYTVSMADAHTGLVHADGVKVTGNRLKGVLGGKVDIDFDPMSGITASWDDEAGTFAYQSAETITFLHLEDNTTTFQTGVTQGVEIRVQIGDMRSSALGLDEALVSDVKSASRTIDLLDVAIDKVSMQRTRLAVSVNQIEHAMGNLSVTHANLTAAESRIRDTDMAKAMTLLASQMILNQTSTAMLAQANQVPESVLSLMR